MIERISKTEEEEDHLGIEEGMMIDLKEILETDLKDALTVEKKDILPKTVLNVYIFIISQETKIIQ